jgi:hypothetical protein
VTMKDAPMQREQTYVSLRRVWAMRLSILLFVRLLSVRLTLLGRMAAVALLLLLLVVIAMALLAVTAVVIVARHVRFEAGL